MNSQPNIPDSRKLKKLEKERDKLFNKLVVLERKLEEMRRPLQIGFRYNGRI